MDLLHTVLRGWRDPANLRLLQSALSSPHLSGCMDYGFVGGMSPECLRASGCFRQLCIAVCHNVIDSIKASTWFSNARRCSARENAKRLHAPASGFYFRLPTLPKPPPPPRIRQRFLRGGGCGIGFWGHGFFFIRGVFYLQEGIFVFATTSKSEVGNIFEALLQNFMLISQIEKRESLKRKPLISSACGHGCSAGCRLQLWASGRGGLEACRGERGCGFAVFSSFV